MRIIITGGEGNVCHPLAQALEKEGHEVIIIDKRRHPLHDLRNPFMANLIFDDIGRCDVLIHGAANIGGIGYFHWHQYETYNENIAITLNTLRYAKFDKFIYISSSMVYEGIQTMPLKEEMAEDNLPKSPYGKAKRICEELVMHDAQHRGYPYLIVRPFNIYPEEIDFEAPYGEQHVLPDFIRKIVFERVGERLGYVPIFGDGFQTRCFTHISDFCNAMLRLLNVDNTTINVANNEEVTMRGAATLIWKLYYGDRNIKFKCLPSFKWDVRRRVPDITEMSKYYKPRISLEEGLKMWLHELGVEVREDA